jgi:hypothetical protein
MLDRASRSQPGNLVDPHDSTVFHRARKHRSAC